MSREKLLSTLDKSERITKNLSKNGLNKIVKMQNLSLNEPEQIEIMNNLSLNKLKQDAKNRSIKTNKNTSKADSLIALLKSNKSHTELRRSEDNNEEIQEIKKIFSKLRKYFSKEEINKIRRKFHFKESIDECLK